MSWWPEPDTFTTNDRIIDHAHGNSSTNQQPFTNKRGSVPERLGNGLGNLVYCHHGHPTKSEVSSDHPDIVRQEAISIVPEPATVPKTGTGKLFHIVLTSSHFYKEVNSVVQAVRICGTYTSPNAATVFIRTSLPFRRWLRGRLVRYLDVSEKDRASGARR